MNIYFSIISSGVFQTETDKPTHSLREKENINTKIDKISKMLFSSYKYLREKGNKKTNKKNH